MTTLPPNHTGRPVLRQVAGTPEGGQFAPQPHPESGVILTEPGRDWRTDLARHSVTRMEQRHGWDAEGRRRPDVAVCCECEETAPCETARSLGERHAALTAGGYVPATEDTIAVAAEPTRLTWFDYQHRHPALDWRGTGYAGRSTYEMFTLIEDAQEVSDTVATTTDHGYNDLELARARQVLRALEANGGRYCIEGSCECHERAWSAYMRDCDAALFRAAAAHPDEVWVDEECQVHQAVHGMAELLQATGTGENVDATDSCSLTIHPDGVIDVDDCRLRPVPDQFAEVAARDDWGYVEHDTRAVVLDVIESVHGDDRCAAAAFMADESIDLTVLTGGRTVERVADLAVFGGLVEDTAPGFTVDQGLDGVRSLEADSYGEVNQVAQAVRHLRGAGLCDDTGRLTPTGHQELVNLLADQRDH